MLGSLVGYDDAWKLNDGLPVAAEFPADASFPMDPDEPGRLALADMLGNRNGQALVSARVGRLPAHPRPARARAAGGRDHRSPRPSGGGSLLFWCIRPRRCRAWMPKASEPEYNPMDRTRVLTLEATGTRTRR